MPKDKPKVRINLDRLTEAEEDEILRLAMARKGYGMFFPSLEALVSDPDGFGISTLTPLQRAICRVIEGIPLGEFAALPVVKEALGGTTDVPIKPSEVLILAGIRTAKSLMAAATAIWASQTCDLSNLRDGEIPRYSVLSLELDNARVVLGHLVGALQKPRLASLRVQVKQEQILDEIGAESVGSEYLRHPTGRVVEIRVVAGKRAGGSLVSRWSFGACFDEAPRMLGSSEGVINYDDARRAVRGRLLPGARLLSIGSPWQPYGPVYDIVQNEWGRPSQDRVVIRGKGPDMNPVWWTPARCEEMKRSDIKTYQTDVLAEFADEEESLFPQNLLASCTTTLGYPVSHQPGHDYVAAMDPATRGNAWTLVVASRRGRKKRVVFHREWRGSSIHPLNPREVIGQAKEDLEKYQLDWCYTDQWAADANKAVALERGLALIDVDWTQQEALDAYSSLAAAMAMGTIEIPGDPQLQKDLKLVKKKPSTAKNGYSIHLPATPDGRHCDYAPALARAMKQWLDDERALPPKPGEDGFAAYYEAQMIEKEEADFERKNRDPMVDEDLGDSDPFDDMMEQAELVDYARRQWG